MMSEPFNSVWDALEYTPQEVANMQSRAELMREIQNVINRSRMTQTTLAHTFGVTQPRLADLMRGRIDKFSIDALINMLSSAGSEVKFGFSESAA